MNSRPSRFAVALALGVGVVAAFSAAAQQPILFSKPVESAEEKSSSFLQDPPSRLQGRADQFNAHKQVFSLPEDPLPLPPQMMPPPNQSLKDALNRRKYWMLMTPEEYVGLPTPEKILGLPDPTGDDKRTYEERYLRRQDRAAAFSATNGLRRSEASLLRNDANPFAPRDQRDPRDVRGLNGDFKPDSRADAGFTKYFDRLVNSSAEPSFGANQNANAAWSSAFTHPAPLPKPNLEQIADMERFRAMLESSSPPEKPPVATRFSTTPAAAPTPNLLETPLFNQVGNSYKPLQGGISRPTGITPLPSLTGPNLQPATPKKPLTQLPPWLSKEPQPLENPFSPFNTRRW